MICASNRREPKTLGSVELSCPIIVRLLSDYDPIEEPNGTAHHCSGVGLRQVS
jgi:hypothetical protein